MKKAYKSIIIFGAVIAVVIAVGFSSDNGSEKSLFYPGKIINNIKKISEEINSLKLTRKFEEVKLFSYQQYPENSKVQKDFVRKAANLNIKKESLKNILANPSENITFRIPVSGTEYFDLELKRTNVFSSDAKFTLLTNQGKTYFDYRKGLHYIGIIKGNNNSVAGVSIFENNVVVIASDKKGNYVLGQINNKKDGLSENYVFYNDNDLNVKNKFECKVDDYSEKMIKYTENAMLDVARIKENNPDVVNSTVPIKLYFETDYSVHQQYHNYPAAVYDHMSAVFTITQAIYQNEQIPMEISEVSVWMVPDPYDTVNTALGILKLFGVRNKDNFYGNLGHLISFAHNQNLGGLAWVNVLCQPYNSQDTSGRFAFCNVDTNYSGYPVYSWEAQCITHQIGHNIGSRHTHACVWPISPGVIGAIDSCYTPEGTCFTNTQTNIEGTIMSFCNLNGAINFSNGFGPLPGDTIRYRYARAKCLHEYLNSSQPPNDDSLIQNFPNPFNPGTKIQFYITKDVYATLKVFDITGKEVAKLVNNHFYTKGIYSADFNAADFSLSSGVYFYQLITTNAADNKVLTQVRKMILTK